MILSKIRRESMLTYSGKQAYKARAQAKGTLKFMYGHAQVEPRSTREWPRKDPKTENP